MKRILNKILLTTALITPSSLSHAPGFEKNKDVFGKQISQTLTNSSTKSKLPQKKLTPEITEEKEEILIVEKDTISFEQAVKLAEKPDQLHKYLTIHYVQGSAEPFDYGKKYEKKYLYWHGSATDDILLIKAGFKDANFAYAILKNGTVLQFFDDTKGAGAIGGFGAVDNNALSGLQGIGIEFSANMNTTGTDVEEPNNTQIHNALLLKKHLLGVHPIKKIHTSRQAVQNTPQEFSSDIHFDTKTWAKSILDTLGVHPLDSIVSYKPTEILERLEMSDKLGKSKQTDSSPYFKRTKKYRKTLLDKNNTPTDSL